MTRQPSLWQRLLLLPLDLMVVGTEALAQGARGAQRIASQELARTTQDCDCCGKDSATPLDSPLDDASPS